jgi:hypothetical protein
VKENEIVMKLKFVVCTIVSFCLIVLLSRQAVAQTKVKFAIMPSEGFSYQDGETHPIAPSLTQGFMLAHKWGSYGWATELDAVSAFTVANPSPQLVFGPAFFVSDRHYILVNAVVRYNPEQKGKDDSLMLGGGLVMGFVISKEVALGTGIGFGKVVSGEPGPLCFVAGPKLSFSLPL